jgi:hypothetical protein
MAQTITQIVKYVIVDTNGGDFDGDLYNSEYAAICAAND